MKHSILVHNPSDDVGVAAADLHPGRELGIVTLEGADLGSMAVVEDIPLGHKIALRDMPPGHKLLKYGRPIGETTQAIKRGDHVHTHNLRTQRWKV